MELVMLLLQGLRVLELGIKPGAITAEDWVILLGIALPNQREGILLIFRLSCSFLKRKKQGFNIKLEFDFIVAVDKALVYDTDGSAEVKLNDNCYDNKIFNMFTQEEQYTDLLEPILEPQLVPQNDNYVTFVVSSMVQSGGTVETSFTPNEETRAHHETVYCNLVEQVAQKMALGYPNPSYLKKAQLKQKSLYNGNLLLEEHDPSAMCDLEETLELAQESREKIRFLKKEIKLANYAKINHLSGVFVPQTTKSKEELFLSNVSNMVTVSKTISIPNKDLLDDTTPSVAQKFLNEEKEYVVLWNNWYTKCEECKYDKISYDKAYNDIQQKVERLQARLRVLKGKSSDTPSALNTFDPLNQKLESKIVELEFQMVNYECEISHLKTTYKNLFDSITSNRAHAKLHNLNYENAQQRAWVFGNTSKSMNNTLGTSVTPHVDKPKHNAVTPHSKKLHASIPSHSVPQPKEFNVVKHRNVISPGRVPSASKSSEAKKNVTIEDHRKTLLLSENLKTMSSDCNNIKLAIQNDKSEIVCGTCCSKHMTGNIKLLINFVWKFLGTVRFGNDHIAAILGYGDLKWGILQSPWFISLKRRTKNIIETMNVTFDELSVMAFEQNSLRPGLQSMTSGQISSELGLTYALSTITPQRPSEHDMDIIFKPLDNEYLGGRPSEAPRTIPVTPQQRNHTPSPTAFAADDVLNAMFEGDLFVNPFATPSTESVESRSVLTRNQLKTDGDMCIYALTVSIMEPKSVKEALTDLAWIESMQEELHQFIRLDVWELVPSSDGIKPLTLKC
nr:Gag-Pol polyprotein [Tanacetum cinerariifolium]